MTKYIYPIILFLCSYSQSFSQNNCVLVCNSDVEFALDSAGFATVEIEDLLDFIDPDCDTNLVAFIGNPNVTLDSAVASTLTLDCQSLLVSTYIVGDTLSGNACWGNISITDPFGTCLDSLQENEVSVQFNGSFSGPYVDNAAVNGQSLRHLGLNNYAVDTTALNAGLNTFDVVTLNSLNGVSTLDVVLIQRFLFGESTLVGAQAIRADADGSGFVGTDDVFVLTETILGSRTPTNYTVTVDGASAGSIDPYDFTDIYDLTYDRSEITASGLSFDVYQAGDVNGSAGLWSGSDPVENRSTYQASYADQLINAGEEVTIALTLSSNSIAGIHLTLDQTSASILDLSVRNADGRPATAINADKASIVYVPHTDQEEVIIDVMLSSTVSGMLSDILYLHSERPQEVITSDLQESQVVLQPISTTATIDDNYSAAAMFVTPTLLTSNAIITVPNGAKSLEIYNMAGQLVMQRIVQEAQVSIDRGDLPRSGIYIARATGVKGSTTTRFVVK
jgi:hypothetical protein